MRIVLLTGGVETLGYFSKEMGKAFQEEGHNIFYFDLNQWETQQRMLKKFLKPGVTVLITFNFIGLCEESGLFHPQHGYLWEQYQIPVYNIVVDHPLYYHDHLSRPVRSYHHIGIDKNHVKYVKTYYPDIFVCGFLPLAGSELELSGQEKAGKEGAGAERDVQEKRWDCWESRKISVLMTGNYTEPAFCDPYIERINEEYTLFYHRIIDRLLENPDCPLEEAVLALCIQEMGEITQKDFRQVLSSMNFIDLYVRNQERGNVVRMLTDHGIAVEAVGSGWEKLVCKCPENLHIHKMTDSRTCLELAAQSKISLNVMPGFKKGAHDRIFNGILNGAVSVSDENPYIRRLLPKGEGISYYNMKQLEELPGIVSGLLGNPDRAEVIRRKGYQKVKTGHTWKNRAQTLLQWINKKE